MILIDLSRRKGEVLRAFRPMRLRWIEMTSYLLFLCIGLVGIFIGKNFLGNFLPLGNAGSLPSAGFVFFLNLIIGIKVGAGVSLICFDLMAD